MTTQRIEALKEFRKSQRAIANSTKFIIVNNLVAFSGGRVESLATCSVDGAGTVCVFDSIANAMTSCHSISETDQERIRAAVKAGKSVL